MIKDIKKIKNLGIFADYKADKDLQPFNRYNLFYGWNRSGKTTLTKLFTGLEAGALSEFLDLEYEIEVDTGSLKQGQSLNTKIRVFNEDYILNNIQILQSKAKAIYILGGENKKLLEEIKTDEKNLKEEQQKLQTIIEDSEKQKKEKNTQFTNIARIISQNTSGEATRNYDKRDAEMFFSNMNGKKLLDDSQMQKQRLTLRQFERQSIDELKEMKFPYKGNLLNIGDTLNKIIQESKTLCLKTVVSVIIERLNQNNDISRWVEEGLNLHSNHKSVLCEFCNQPLFETRIVELQNYFNEADKKFKNYIDNLSKELMEIYSFINEISLTDKARLYEELQEDYQVLVEAFEKNKKQILEKITKLSELLKDKKTKTRETIILDFSIDISPFTKVIDNINAEIKKHNEKSNDFKSEKENAQNLLEKHYLSTIYDDIKELNRKIGINIETEQRQKDVIGDLNTRITDNKNKISSSHIACKEINDNLKSFLGSEELSFKVAKEGYIINRNGRIATNLSEGEKTAIAFIYFIIHLRDQDFDLKQGIVVIDDPISSLDLNILFRVGSYIEKKLRTAKQLFIFTHNYDFFNQMKKWFNNDLNSNRDLLQHTGNFYMIKNYLDTVAKQRCASISQLDPLLQNYESEYHYLFSKLYSFQKDIVTNGNGNIEAIYHYPNLARKFFECFLSFRVPTIGSFYTKVMSLKRFDKDISSTDLGEVYNFVNSHSHLDTKTGLLQFDPSDRYPI